jgi:hypothetical protein
MVNAVAQKENTDLGDFDLDDVVYMADHFSFEQIIREVRRSEFVEGYHGGCVDFNTREVVFEREYQALCRAALELLRSRNAAPQYLAGDKVIDVNALKNRLDIISVIGRFVDLKKAGRTYKALCPFHSEKGPSFIVYPDKQNWHCYGACNTGGDIVKFVMQYQHCDFKRAIAILEGLK